MRIRTKSAKNKQDDFQRFQFTVKRFVSTNLQDPLWKSTLKRKRNEVRIAAESKPHAANTHGGIIKHVITASCVEELSYRLEARLTTFAPHLACYISCPYLKRVSSFSTSLFSSMPGQNISADREILRYAWDFASFLYDAQAAFTYSERQTSIRLF